MTTSGARSRIWPIFRDGNGPRLGCSGLSLAPGPRLVFVWRVGTEAAALYPLLVSVDGMCECAEQAAVGRPEPANRDA
jgi:hypothetical protein